MLYVESNNFWTINCNSTWDLIMQAYNPQVYSFDTSLTEEIHEREHTKAENQMGDRLTKNLIWKTVIKVILHFFFCQK